MAVRGVVVVVILVMGIFVTAIGLYLMDWGVSFLVETPYSAYFQLCQGQLPC
jgi:hypothetical protein